MMEKYQKERAADRVVGIGLAKTSRGGVHGSDHDQIDPAVFETPPCQAIPRHLLDPGPVLTEIARSLMLGLKSGLQATSLRQRCCSRVFDRRQGQ